LVIANKTDTLTPPQAAAALDALKRATAAPIVPVSAVQEAGLGRLAGVLRAIAAARVDSG